MCLKEITRLGLVLWLGVSLVLLSGGPTKACGNSIDVEKVDVIAASHAALLVEADRNAAATIAGVQEGLGKVEAGQPDFRSEERKGEDSAVEKPIVDNASADKATVAKHKVVEDNNETAGAEVSRAYFDMDVLIERLKGSDVIGVFTKLALRSDALDLMDMVKASQRNANRMTLDEVRARFDGLLLKVLALLDDDPVLSGDISVAREDIWKSLLEVKT